MSRKSYMLFFILLFCAMQVSNVIAWEGKFTHRAITEKAVKRSVLARDYLQTQLGLQDGLNTNLELLDRFQNDLEKRADQGRETWYQTNLSIMNWLRHGSHLEDVPIPRARHHFHDPIRNTGLNNYYVDLDVAALLLVGSKALYWSYWPFDATGGLAFDRAMGRAHDWGIDWESEPEYLINKYN